jgi:hypothetical protein
MLLNKYYKILGVKSNASQDEIKRAYHKLAYKYHPDVSHEPDSAKKFHEINEAYKVLKNQANSKKKTSRVGILVGMMLVAIIIAAIGYHKYSSNHREIQAGILKGDSNAVQSLEQADINLATKVIDGTDVKAALIDFYIKNPPVWSKLNSYNNSIRNAILKDETVYLRLRDYYYKQINEAVSQDKYKEALTLLGTLKKEYPDASELFHKNQEIQAKKQQRLADLSQKYMDCLYKTWVPLLERTHCMATARNEIELVGIEHELPTDSNLPIMYAKEIRTALKDKNYDNAEELLLDWEKLLPANSEQRNAFKQILFLRQERDTIIADLSGDDQMQIAKRLHQLSVDPILQQEIFEIPKVKTNLLKYNSNEILTIIASNHGDLTSDYENKLKQILAIPKPEPVTPPPTTTSTEVASSNSEIPIAAPIIPIPTPSQSENTSINDNNQVTNLLNECQNLFNKNYLTRGRKTALSCYQDVLQIEPNNNEALNGMKNIEDRYFLWADSALRRKQFSRVQSYIDSLQKVNSNSSRLAELKRNFKLAQQNHQRAIEEAKAAELARQRKAAIEAEIARERAAQQARLKAVREARLKAERERRIAREKAARREQAAREQAAREREARLRAAREAREKAARLRAAREAREREARLKAAREAREKSKAEQAAKLRANSCTEILKQLSMGVKPLTPGQQSYFQTKCL